MNIGNLTINQVRELQNLFGNSVQSHPYEIGKNYLIRTVTMTHFGKLIAVHEQELVLQDAAWIADTGRFSDSLISGDFDEIEPFPDGEVIVSRGGIIDAVQLPLPLKRERK
jgi:hypothetical protein